MRYFFAIQDRNDVITSIIDPIGWDSLGIMLKRDPEKHGLFFDFQNNEFEYQGAAAKLLRDEYELYGTEGKMNLIINYECATGQKLLYAGRFVFSAWDDFRGSECSVILPVETTSDIMTFRNRIDQKVLLETAATFDGTAVAPYAALPFTAALPGKSIFVQDYAENLNSNLTTWLGEWEDTGGSQGVPQMAFFIPGYAKVIANEIGGFNVPSDATEAEDVAMPFSWTPPLGWVELPYFDPFHTPFDQFFPLDAIGPIVNYDAELGRVHGDAPLSLTLDILFDAELTPYQVSSVNTTNGIRIWTVYCGLLPDRADPNDPTKWTWFNVSLGSSPQEIWNDHLSPITTSVSSGAITYNENITLHRGDRIYFFHKIHYEKKDAYAGDPAFDITYNAGSYFKLSGLSNLPATSAKLFAINEAWSRITEVITDGQMLAYSDLYGRTDSEPYAAAEDGCGSLTAITNGLFIRRMQDKLPDRPPLYSLSIKDMWEGLNPIHNIGMGVEADPERIGFNRLRIESWDYFYQDTVIFNCIGVTKVKRTLKKDKHVSLFKFGYETWEAEQFNGIDEFLTKREYRTELTQINQTLSQISTWIASGFAWEVTRRLGNDTSEDWRYDKNTFVVAMERDGSDLIVQLGNITDPDHIVDPDTIYNWAIRPSVMALRWLPYVLASYRVATTASKIIFLDGDGNLYAEGYLGSSFCRTEDEVVMTEKQDLSPANMDTPADGLPIWFNETIEFDFPLTVAEFQTIMANPTGLIHYENEHVSADGWINTLEFKPEAGIGEFTLIPKR